MPATSIGDVVDRLSGIVSDARRDGSPMGYFPALYRIVTVRVQEGIAAGHFDDGPRMERLDVVFANRYLEARDAWTGKHTVTRSWSLAFETTRSFWPVVLQHLLLGINAHINLDLGIAAAQVAPGRELAGLKGDFNRINRILAELVDGVQDQLGRVWPVLGLLDRVADDADEAVINFAMSRARDHAWRVAERLAPMSRTAQEATIRGLDGHVESIGGGVRNPGLQLASVLRLIRLGERGSVEAKIALLEELA